ncbi:hypothetical protein PR048_014756 [Dryococelus australis]|uniref:Uncharacterized protein n=1 Tax=Dryococelus australis TaxID=614101 RepID=A0ABQ9HF19_9NEOP|nr:hypothetical protein PR048_014756 [Dryococelus australis]
MRLKLRSHDITMLAWPQPAACCDTVDSSSQVAPKNIVVSLNYGYVRGEHENTDYVNGKIPSCSAFGCCNSSPNPGNRDKGISFNVFPDSSEFPKEFSNDGWKEDIMERILTYLRDQDLPEEEPGEAIDLSLKKNMAPVPRPSIDALKKKHFSQFQRTSQEKWRKREKDGVKMREMERGKGMEGCRGVEGRKVWKRGRGKEEGPRRGRGVERRKRGREEEEGCRYKCFDRVPADDRREILERFRSLVSKNEQDAHLQELIAVCGIKQRRSH